LPRLRALTRHALLVTAAISGPALAAAPGTTPSADVATSASVLSTFDRNLLHDINDARASRGLRRLALAAGTTDVAHQWSCHLARYRTLQHNPNLAADLSSHGSSLWTSYGENIGWQSAGYVAHRMFRAYMHDPSHRANILGQSYRYVGIWSKRHKGRRYNTTDFVGRLASSYSTSYGGVRASC
jgi:uncharacterized protein YkwD